MAKCTFLVWNVNGSSLNNTGKKEFRSPNIAEAIFRWHQEYNLDIVFLIECSFIDQSNLKNRFVELGLKENDDFEILTDKKNPCHIKIIRFLNETPYSFRLSEYRKTKGNDAEGESFEDKVRFLEIRYNSEPALLLSVIHLYSKINIPQKTQEDAKILEHIYDKMDKVPIWKDKLVIAGDFNLNPYEYPLYDNNGLLSGIKSTYNSAFLERQSASYFYNPSWKFFAEQKETNYTYFMDKVFHNQVRFNLLDGVILQNAVKTNFLNDKYRILSSYYDKNGNKHSLLNDDSFSINKNSYSDHLPIIFAFDFSPLINKQLCLFGT